MGSIPTRGSFAGNNARSLVVLAKRRVKMFWKNERFVKVSLMLGAIAMFVMASGAPRMGGH